MSTPTIKPDPANIRGITAARFLRSLVVARGDSVDGAAFAEGNPHWLQHRAIVNALKAPVAAVDATHAAALMQPIGTDFAEYLAPRTIIGRLSGVRRVPFDTRLIAQTSGATASFVGVGLAKPVTAMTFSTAETTLSRRKVASLAVITEELARHSRVVAERMVLNELARATAAAMDEAFISPNNLGDDATPASITSTASLHISSGSTVAAIDTDLRTLVDALLYAGSDLTSAIWVMRPSTAMSLAMIRGTGDAAAFPGIGALGGSLLGLPVITSGSVPGDSSGTSITLLDQDAVLLADDGEAELGVSTQASIEMSDTPTDGAVQQVSMWQMNLACLRAERWIHWAPRREVVAATLTGVEY